MEDLFALARELSDGSVWTKAVTLARHAEITCVGTRDLGEHEYHVRSSNRNQDAIVLLVPVDESWDCDCGGGLDPCEHILATLIAVKQGAVRHGSSSGTRVRQGIVVHAFSRNGSVLSFSRYLVSGDSRIEIKTSLLQAIELSKSQSASRLSVSDQDLNIDHVLLKQKSGVLDPQTMRYLLPSLARVAHVELDGECIQVSPEAMPVVAEVVDVSEGYLLRRKMIHGTTEVFDNSAIVIDGVLSAIEDSSLRFDDFEMLKGDGRIFGASESLDLATRVIPSLRAKIVVEVAGCSLPKARKVRPSVRFEAYSLEQGRSLSVLPIIQYGAPCIAEIRLGQCELKNRYEVPIRDMIAEGALLRNVEQQYGVRRDAPTVFSGQRVLSLTAEIANHCTEKSDISLCRSITTMVPTVAGDSAGLEVEFQAPNGDRIPGQTILDAWKSNSNNAYFHEGFGWLSFPDRWLASHSEALKRLLQGRMDGDGGSRVFLPDVLEISESLEVDPPQYFARLSKGLTDCAIIPDSKLPTELTCRLRDYQKIGVNWLSFLMDHEIGALLADDMGLGKTVQALCALRGRSLIVCPTSVLSSWKEQIASFLPGRKVSMYHGVDRKIDRDAEVTLSSYGILRADVDSLAKCDWETVVLDEAHVIRNPYSQVARAAYKINSRYKICLTGTPIENTPRDLWSQCNFLNPGLLGTLREFEHRYGQGDELKNEGEISTLRARVAPFILRRFKHDVAKELPPKTEVILECELTSEERVVYDAIVASTRDSVVDKLDTNGSVFSVLEMLLRLRQACCHTGLVPGISSDTSSKLALLMHHLTQSKAYGHRCLIFSQWVSLLDKVEPLLNDTGISFGRIDGSTTNRGAVVNDFQSTSGPDVLLISLKAGGVGLTLTAADHVYILDPWWNPAAEDQAADRAHRIGQDNPVVIHKLVARDTVEHRVLELQRRKRQLIEASLGEGTDGDFSLSREELLYVLDEARRA
jgi:superfamily II DNA or RNA helicase